MAEVVKGVRFQDRSTQTPAVLQPNPVVLFRAAVRLARQEEQGAPHLPSMRYIGPFGQNGETSGVTVYILGQPGRRRAYFDGDNVHVQIEEVGDPDKPEDTGYRLIGKVTPPNLEGKLKEVQPDTEAMEQLRMRYTS